MITVYYDGKCNICKKEINYYKKLPSKKSFNWCDIANYPEKINNKIILNDALLYLHATDEKGRVYIGVEAFILIWKNLKNWKYLAYFISIPIIKSIANYVYIKFAKHRFSKITYCEKI
tara:strand:+ start:272 stop:625 length:354 start_codon:yes stop_codon:yes gene_type:complete